MSAGPLVCLFYAPEKLAGFARQHNPNEASALFNAVVTKYSLHNHPVCLGEKWG